MAVESTFLHVMISLGKPIVNTNSCQMTHTGYAISGRIRVRMDDGTEQEFGPGEVMYVPPELGWMMEPNKNLVQVK
jgi:quercetin dioxygenase-like cupin family protein